MKMIGYCLMFVLVVLSLGGCGSNESASVEAPSRSQPSVLEERQVEVVDVLPRSISILDDFQKSTKNLLKRKKA